jgi:hypothetical protein
MDVLKVMNWLGIEPRTLRFRYGALTPELPVLIGSSSFISVKVVHQGSGFTLYIYSNMYMGMELSSIYLLSRLFLSLLLLVIFICRAFVSPVSGVLHLKHLPSFISLFCSLIVNLSTSMAFGSLSLHGK